MIIGIQIIAILFSLCMIYFAIISFKKGDLNGSEIVSWVTLWFGTMVIVIFPELLRAFSMTFLVTRVFDLMVIGGFVVVLMLVGSSYLRTKRNEKKLEELVRKLALKNAKPKK